MGLGCVRGGRVPQTGTKGSNRSLDVALHEHIDATTAKKLHRLGDEPVIASLTLVGGDVIDVAVRREHSAALIGTLDGRLSTRISGSPGVIPAV